MSWKLRRFREVAIDQLSTLFLYFLIYDVNIYIYTDKNAEVATSLLTSCNNLLQQADIRMRSHGLR